MKHLWVALLAAAAATGSAFAADAPKRGGTLSIALNADIRGLEPGINRDANTDRVVQQIFEGLVAFKYDLSVGPALAESWAVEDGGKTFRFTLREGVTFHNGEPLTASAVKWSWDRQFGSAAWPCRRFFDSAGTKVLAMEAPDAKTVVYRLEQSSALFLKQLANVQCGVLVAHPESVDAAGEWKTPIGTGPLKLKEWKRGQQISLERHSGYKVSSAPASGLSGARNLYVDEVHYKIIPDASAAEAAVQTGAVDIYPDLEPQHMAALDEGGATVISAPGLAWSALLIQTRDTVLSNPKIRLAMAHAIDRSQIAEMRTAKLAKANPSAVAEVSAYFDKNFLAAPAYDPAKARRLLAEAGYKGEVIRLQTNKRYVSMDDNAVVVQAMLASVGFQVELEVLDWATQLDNYLKGKFQIQSFAYSARFDPGLAFAAFIEDKDKLPSAQWDDPKAISLLAESVRTLDDKRRKEIFVDLHRLMQESTPMIILYYAPTAEAIHRNVQGYQTWAANIPLTWGVWKKS